MNKEKLAMAGCIVLSVVLSLSFGLFFFFKMFEPTVSEVYEKLSYYPEDLYKDYQTEAEKMINNHEYTYKYPVETTFDAEGDRTTLVIKIGEYDEGKNYSNYLTATVKNYGTNEQEVTFERSRKSADEAKRQAQRYRNITVLFAMLFLIILVRFTMYLISNSRKKRYSKVFMCMKCMVLSFVILICINYLFPL